MWCYCLEQQGKVICAVPRDNHPLQGQCSMSKVIGQPYNILTFYKFKWYKWVKYRLQSKKSLLPLMRLGWCLGPSSDKGNAMSQYVLTCTGAPIPIQTLGSLLPLECNRACSQPGWALAWHFSRRNWFWCSKKKLNFSQNLAKTRINLSDFVLHWHWTSWISVILIWCT